MRPHRGERRERERRRPHRDAARRGHRAARQTCALRAREAVPRYRHHGTLWKNNNREKNLYRLGDVLRETGRNHEKPTMMIFRATRDSRRVALRVELCVVLPREHVSRAISLARARLSSALSRFST